MAFVTTWRFPDTLLFLTMAEVFRMGQCDRLTRGECWLGTRRTRRSDRTGDPHHPHRRSQGQTEGAAVNPGPGPSIVALFPSALKTRKTIYYIISYNILKIQLS